MLEYTELINCFVSINSTIEIEPFIHKYALVCTSVCTGVYTGVQECYFVLVQYARACMSRVYCCARSAGLSVCTGMHWCVLVYARACTLACGSRSKYVH